MFSPLAFAMVAAQDARFGLRMLRRNPGFTLISVLTLAIGIGANTALFSVVDRVLLRPLPYPDSARLMILWAKPPSGGIAPVSPANFVDFRYRNQSFERLSATNLSEFNVTVGDVVERLPGYRVTAEFFDTVSVKPALGRLFLAGDDRPGAPKLAVISYGAWQTRFGGDRQIVGQSLAVDADQYTIIGVTPAGFRFAMAPEIWVPLHVDAAGARDFPILLPIGKLKPGIPVARAKAELDGIARNLAREYPKALKGWGIDVLPLKDYLGTYARHDVLILFGAVGFVLLIVSVNVANLLLAKASARQRELAVRASLGAGRPRLVCQLLTEGLLIAAWGGAAGVLLASWLCGVAAKLVPRFLLDAVPEVGIDWHVLLFTFGVSVTTGLLISIAPAWRSSSVNLNDMIKQTGRTAPGGGRSRLGSSLVVAEVALSMILLTGAALMTRSLAGLFAVDPGFHSDHVLTAHITRPPARYKSPEQLHALDRALIEKLRELPGARTIAIGSHLPMQGMALTVPFEIVSRPFANGRAGGTVQYMSDGYFEALGIRLRSGRTFTPADNESAPRVVLVNEAFVRRYLKGERAVGQRILLDERWVRQRGRAPVPWEIAGVIADVKIGNFGSEAMPQIYAPLYQTPLAADVVVVHTDIEPGTLAGALRNAIHSVDPEIPVTNVTTMRQIARASVAQPVQQTFTISAFALVALILAALGIYGVMSYTVSQDAHSMGIRLALGANPADLMKRSLARGARIAAIGLAIGVAGSLALTRLIASRLYGVKASDPLTYLAVSAILFGVAMAACYVPARRSARVDPVAALRCE